MEVKQSADSVARATTRTGTAHTRMGCGAGSGDPGARTVPTANINLILRQGVRATQKSEQALPESRSGAEVREQWRDATKAQREVSARPPSDLPGVSGNRGALSNTGADIVWDPSLVLRYQIQLASQNLPAPSRAKSPQRPDQRAPDVHKDVTLLSRRPVHK
ncbi:hypothetical protein AAFF_G00373500 [Aldrovandia affinis]|uniref:Uncharacterized protein n=1 Tax=Aldrovandia affinis TaxID=143900 RepID=A0AAD7SGM4_9TELE|nr:hypothetical protein AAFF_G00373500 [Aldrovandia affinis]